MKVFIPVPVSQKPDLAALATDTIVLLRNGSVFRTVAVVDGGFMTALFNGNWETASSGATHWLKPFEVNSSSELVNAYCEGEAKQPSGQRFVSGCCEGERCMICGEAATAKVEETIFFDDPCPVRHPLTAYICEKHFNRLMRPYAENKG